MTLGLVYFGLVVTGCLTGLWLTRRKRPGQSVVSRKDPPVDNASDRN